MFLDTHCSVQVCGRALGNSAFAVTIDKVILLPSEQAFTDHQWIVAGASWIRLLALSHSASHCCHRASAIDVDRFNEIQSICAMILDVRKFEPSTLLGQHGRMNALK